MRTLHCPIGCLILMCATVGIGADPRRDTIQEVADEAVPADALDWTRGPTGVRGWIRSADGHTHAARRIHVTAITTGSPAVGALSVGDAVVGVNGASLTSDARRQFADAVTATEAKDGTLRLKRLRAGRTGTVELKLLREIRTYLARVKKISPGALTEFDKSIDAIESSTAAPTLVSVTEFRTRPVSRSR